MTVASLRVALAIAGLGMIIGPIAATEFGLAGAVVGFAVPFYVGVAMLPRQK